MTVTGITRTIVAIAVLAMVPTVWYFALTDVPSLQAVRDSHTADLVGVWVFTWALVWIASLAALPIAFVCWKENREEAQENREPRRPAA